MRRALGRAALTAALLALPASLSGQAVTGVVTDAGTTAPLTGVLVSALTPSGERGGAVLTDADGTFTLSLDGPGSYRLLAERIGLATVRSDLFEVPAGALIRRPLAMTASAVSLEGLVVDARVQSCRVDPAEAPLIQRWWSEVRKALDISAFVQNEGIARFRLQQFQRVWTKNLRSIVSEDTSLRVGFSSRPFVSAGASSLSEAGYVQGPEGGREYFAPDAEILLSDAFLTQHCFSLRRESEREGQVGIHFEPTRSTKTPEILGTLWIDTTTAELDRLEYRYANLDWLPPNEAGGEVVFDYLPSGVWIVSDWYIRMPQVGVRAGLAGDTEVVGYVDVGGRVRQLSTTLGGADGRTGSAMIRGVVFDSIRGGPLPGARVALLGTRYSTTTDAGGRFALSGVPTGSHSLSFFDGELTAWGVPSPVVEVTVEDGAQRDIMLAVPRFRTAARAACGAEDVEAVLTGRVVDESGDPVEGATVAAHWEESAVRGPTRTSDFEMTTGTDGRYRICTAPGEARVDLSARVDGVWTDAPPVVLPGGRFTAQEIRVRRGGRESSAGR